MLQEISSILQELRRAQRQLEGQTQHLYFIQSSQLLRTAACSLTLIYFSIISTVINSIVEPGGGVKVTAPPAAEKKKSAKRGGK